MPERSIDVLWVPGEQEAWRPEGGSAVVIDVLRATSVAVVALGNGAQGVLPAADVAAARRLYAQMPPDSALLGGERGAVRIPGFHLGNSPAEYTPAIVSGKLLVVTTTNGTRALLAARGAARVAAAALLNGPAAARWLARGPGGAVLLCAGTEGRVTLEDVVCAGLIAAEVARLWEAAGESVDWTDGARAAAAVARPYAEEPGRALRESGHGRRLLQAGFAADLDLCAGWGTTTIVPEWCGDRLVLPRTPQE